MKLQYQNNITQGKLLLFQNMSRFENSYSQDGKKNELFTIAWNKGNTQKVIIDDVAYQFPQNTILPLLFGQNISLENLEDVVIWRFNREFYCLIDHDSEVGCVGFLYAHSSKIMFIALDNSEVEKFNLLLNLFVEELESADSMQGEMVRMLLGNFIIQITRLAKKQYLGEHVDTQNLKIVQEFNLLVEQHFRKQHAVQFYAEMLAKSSKTLSNLFSVYNDKSPLQVIHNRIMWQAKRLMHYTDKSVKEIAHELGFDDAAHFSRFFKNLTGMNPTSFKSSLTKNH